MQYVVLPLVGFAIGLIIITLGGGGGAFYVGVLTAFLNVPPAIAASTSLATTIPTTAVGALSHWRAGNVNPKLGLSMLGAGVVGSVAGSLCAGLLPQKLYNRITGAVLLLLAVQMLARFLKKGRGAPSGTRASAVRVGEAAFFGLIGGGMSGLMGLSGGAAIVAGLSILGCGALETVGTSVLVLLGISVTGFLTHLEMGAVDWKLVGLLAVGTMAGAFLGPVLLRKADPHRMETVLRPVLVAMTVVMGGILLFR